MLFVYVNRIGAPLITFIFLITSVHITCLASCKNGEAKERNKGVGAMVYVATGWTYSEMCVCGNTMQYRREQAFSHYGWRAKSTKGICTKAPRRVKEKFSECGGRIPARMEPNEMYGQGGEANVPTLSQSTPTNGSIANVTSVRPSSPIRGTSSTEPGQVGSCTVRSRSMWQQDLDEVYQLNNRKELDEKWVSFFYDANVPFNVGRHPIFVEAVNATALAGFNYKPPSYNALQTTLIESKKMEVEAKVKKATSFSIETYGVSLCSDDWDNEYIVR